MVAPGFWQEQGERHTLQFTAICPLEAQNEPAVRISCVAGLVPVTVGLLFIVAHTVCARLLGARMHWAARGGGCSFLPRLVQGANPALPCPLLGRAERMMRAVLRG